jgi:hypothetical protein
MIIRAFPNAVEIKDMEGCSPPHNTCALAASPNMIKILLEIHPDAVRVETFPFFLPLHHCVFFNNPNLTENNTLEHWHLII